MTTTRRLIPMGAAKVFMGNQPQPALDPEAEIPYLRRDEINRQLEHWKPPMLTDGEIEGAAKIYRTWRGRELVPFFLWLDMWAWRRQ